MDNSFFFGTEGMAYSYVNFIDHKLFKEVMKDGYELDAKYEPELGTLSIDDLPLFNEYEWYIQNVASHFSDFVRAFDQITFIISFMNSYDYEKDEDIRPNRIDYLSYNIENFYIRYISLQDRMYQLMNAIFHLCISIRRINKNIILTNEKVKRYEVVVKRCKEIDKKMEKASEIRNGIIHRHLYNDQALHELKLAHDLDISIFSTKDISRNILDRTILIKKEVEERTKEIDEAIKELYVLVNDLFDSLLKPYQYQKQRLRKVIELLD